MLLCSLVVRRGLDTARVRLPGGLPARGAGDLGQRLALRRRSRRFRTCYPPQLALALLPLTALPVDVAAFIGFLGALAALMGALAVLGVRDVRCYAAVVLWAPGWNALEMANVSAVLALALAVAWRYRDATWGTPLALGLAISSQALPLAAARLDCGDAQVRRLSAGDRDRGRGHARRLGGHRLRGPHLVPGSAGQDHVRGQLFDRRHDGCPRVRPGHRTRSSRRSSAVGFSARSCSRAGVVTTCRRSRTRSPPRSC